MTKTRIALIDGGWAFRRNYHHMQGKDPGDAVHATITDIEKWTSGYEGVAVCVDRPPYKRSALYKKHKEGRAKQDPLMYSLMDEFEAQANELGYAVLGDKGYEADDVIATCVKVIREFEMAAQTDIFTSDRDLYQCIFHNVHVLNPTHKRVDAEKVRELEGVGPDQMPALLTLAGKQSNAWPGIKGVGGKTAAKWLASFGSVEALVKACKDAADNDEVPEGMTGRQAGLIISSSELIATGLQVCSLMDDANVPLAEKLWQKKKLFSPADNPAPDTQVQPMPNPQPLPSEPTPAPVPGEYGPEAIQAELDIAQHAQPTAPVQRPSEPRREAQQKQTPDVIPATKRAESPQVHAVVAIPEPTEAPAPLQRVNGSHFTTALEPGSYSEARQMAEDLMKSRMFGDYGRPEAILAIIITGRSMGMDAVASLRNFSVIKGRPALKSQALLALILNSPRCKYFRCTETTETTATFETLRNGDPEPTTMTYTMADAQKAGWAQNHNWKKMPKTMLRWRAVANLARMVYPDVISGIYTEYETEDFA